MENANQAGGEPTASSGPSESRGFPPHLLTVAGKRIAELEAQCTELSRRFSAVIHAITAEPVTTQAALVDKISRIVSLRIALGEALATKPCESVPSVPQIAAAMKVCSNVEQELFWDACKYGTDDGFVRAAMFLRDALEKQMTGGDASIATQPATSEPKE
jgi:hypothetical protein